jgi:hypothetical protein
VTSSELHEKVLADGPSHSNGSQLPSRSSTTVALRGGHSALNLTRLPTLNPRSLIKFSVQPIIRRRYANGRERKLVPETLRLETRRANSQRFLANVESPRCSLIVLITACTCLWGSSMRRVMA